VTILGKIGGGAATFEAIEFARRTVKALLPARVRALLPPVLRNAPLVVRAWPVFKKPLALVHHYLHHTIPPEKCVRLRSGGELILSGHELDMAVVFQVFCDEVYPVDHDKVVVDIGANIGLFSLYAAFRGAGKVYAFEPNREAYCCVLKNIERNNLQGRIVPYHQAVTSRSNEVVTIAKAASPQNRIAHGSAPDDEHESVTTISLNDIVRNEGISRIDLLKMDCEGCEYDILDATDASTFSRIDRIIIEYHDGRELEIEQNLRRHGFKLEKAAADNDRMGMLWFGRA
jgi:FkbM family methyltransferase